MEVVEALHVAAGPAGDRRSSALILVHYARGRMGHALGAHRFADGRVRFFDLHAAPGLRVSEDPPFYAHLSAVSMVVVDDRGQWVPKPRRMGSASVGVALLDPTLDPRYGRGGCPAAG